MKTSIITYRLIGFITIALFCGIFCSSCEDHEYEYLPPEYLQISGVNSVVANSTADFYTFYLEDANYVWTVPSGATITSGQGTTHVTVQFGDSGGVVAVEAAGLRGELDVSIL